MPHAEVNLISTKKLLDEMDYRWVFSTHLGDVVLKKLGYLESQDVTYELEAAYPEFKEIVKKVHEFTILEEYKITPSPQQQEEIADLEKKLDSYQKYYTIRCFFDTNDEPLFSSMKEYDAFLTALTAEEQARLRPALLKLTEVSAGMEVTEGDIALCQEMGIPLKEGMTLDKMTANQVGFFGRLFKKIQNREEDA